MNRQDHSSTITNYAQEYFSTERKFQQKTISEITTTNEETTGKEWKEEEDKWKSPPSNNRKLKKGPKHHWQWTSMANDSYRNLKTSL